MHNSAIQEASGAPTSLPWWTPERVAELKKLAPTGLSCTQIGAEMGTSRNAVIGKLHRLGLRTQNVRGDNSSSRAVDKVKSAREPRERKPRNRIIQANGNSNRLRIIESVESEPIALRCAAVDPLNISLAELHSATCHYPYGDTPPFAFCGHATLDGATYCDLHHELCHKPAHFHLRGIARPDAGSILRHEILPSVLSLAVAGDWEAA